MDLHVDVAIECFFPEVVVFNDVVGEELEGHSHVFVSIKRRFKIHVFYIGPTKFGSWHTNHTVSHFFAETISAVRVVSSYG